ncbi:unnamed protein product, partial [Ceratitis capitata]
QNLHNFHTTATKCIHTHTLANTNTITNIQNTEFLLMISALPATIVVELCQAVPDTN